MSKECSTRGRMGNAYIFVIKPVRKRLLADLGVDGRIIQGGS
jgi:hypothetical protein